MLNMRRQVCECKMQNYINYAHYALHSVPRKMRWWHMGVMHIAPENVIVWRAIFAKAPYAQILKLYTKYWGPNIKLISGHHRQLCCVYTGKWLTHFLPTEIMREFVGSAQGHHVGRLQCTPHL